MADVDANLYSWSTTAASNKPTGATTIGTGLDDNLRELQKVVRQDLANAPTDVASAATTDLGAVASNYVNITGTTTITGFGTVSSGIWKFAKFAGALTLTHNGTSLILPGAANITTAAGDTAFMVSEGSGNWRCLVYSRTASEPLSYATQAQQETGTSTVVAVSPGRQHFHPSASKAWVHFDDGGTATIRASYNVSSVDDDGTGDYGVNFTTALSSANFAAAGMCASPDNEFMLRAASFTTSIEVDVKVSTTGAANDPAWAGVVVFGDI